MESAATLYLPITEEKIDAITAIESEHYEHPSSLSTIELLGLAFVQAAHAILPGNNAILSMSKVMGTLLREADSDRSENNANIRNIILGSLNLAKVKENMHYLKKLPIRHLKQEAINELTLGKYTLKTFLTPRDAKINTNVLDIKQHIERMNLFRERE